MPVTVVIGKCPGYTPDYIFSVSLLPYEVDMVILICRGRTGSLREYGWLSFPKLAPIIVPSTHALPEPCHFPIRVGIHLPSPGTWQVGVKGCVTVSMSRIWQKQCWVNSGARSAKWASLVAQLVKNPPALWETWVWSLGWEDLLEKRKAAHSSTLAWRITWTVYSPCGRNESDMTERLSLFQQSDPVSTWLSQDTCCRSITTLEKQPKP